MKAIVVQTLGEAEVMHLGEVPDPVPDRGEVLVRTRATAVNRADTLQRRGLYPPPPGTSEIIGMEVAGEVEALGEGVDWVRTGDRVMALLAGGGYAEIAEAAAAHRAMESGENVGKLVLRVD